MGATVEVDVPDEEGQGMSLPLPAAALPEGYVIEEFFVSGTARRFTSVSEPADGRWEVKPNIAGASGDGGASSAGAGGGVLSAGAGDADAGGDRGASTAGAGDADAGGDVDEVAASQASQAAARGDAPFRTRVIVRRPADPADFSGTVLVEWFNVTVIEASPEWTYLVDEIGREGHAYVGVSAQRQGVEGGTTVLGVDVDDDVVADAGVSTDTGGLRNTDPARYGTLTHPGDSYSFDMFAQVGRLVSSHPRSILGDLVPERIIAAGESQSAAFVTTFINAVQPLDPVFDGFLVHSRSVIAAPIDGDYARVRVEAGFHGVGGKVPSATRIRDDLDVPVLIFITETDLTALRYALVRQPDTDLLRTWEVAGTAHADVQLLRTILGGPRDAMLGDLLGCGAINTGPHKEVLSAGFHHLVNWVSRGEAPPVGPRIAMVDAQAAGSVGADAAIARDHLGIAVGGVRNPLVDVPVFVPTGDRHGVDPAGVDGDVCALFGSTRQLDAAVLTEMYGSPERYVDAFRASADTQVDAGFLLAADASALLVEAGENRSLFDG